MVNDCIEPKSKLLLCWGRQPNAREFSTMICKERIPGEHLDRDGLSAAGARAGHARSLARPGRPKRRLNGFGRLLVGRVVGVAARGRACGVGDLVDVGVQTLILLRCGVALPVVQGTGGLAHQQEDPDGQQAVQKRR